VSHATVTGTLEAALEYARRGWRVLPLHAVLDWTCAAMLTDMREIGALVPMPRLLAALGFAVDERTRRGPCPIHGGSNPTAFAWTDSGLWRCHSCGEGGDRIALVRAARQCSFRKALEFLAVLAGISLDDGRQSAAEIERARQQHEAELATARLLVDAENDALGEARENLWALHDLRRRASARLSELRNGACERWPGEAELAAWDALRLVADQMPGADAAYCIAAFAAAVERARFALHPERREAMIQEALERGYVADSKGCQFEVNL
jgi:CHC2 zinc finger